MWLKIFNQVCGAVKSETGIPSPLTGEGQDGGAAHAIENFSTLTFIPIEGEEMGTARVRVLW